MAATAAAADLPRVVLMVLFSFTCTSPFTISSSSPSSASVTSPLLFRFSKSLVASPYVDMRYHNGPVITPSIRVYIIWYGRWKTSQQSIIRDFLRSIASPAPSPSVSAWWSTMQLYTDMTGSHISRSLVISGERNDLYSHGKVLTRMSTQDVIKASLQPQNGSLSVDTRGGVYLVLTGEDVAQEDFCSAACGFHYFTYSSIVGYTLPYAWVGNSVTQCRETCAYPFAVPFYMAESVRPLQPPNGDIGVDGMISVIGHELAEMSSNPLINAWFAGSDPEAPTEAADLCEGIYGPGAGGGFTGTVLQDKLGSSFNVNGVGGRRFLIQWLWDPIKKRCYGPNAPP
ncbi:hypothetical protein KP509_05G077700 [Ceratopteris richardii]|uniref:Protein EXORDIUM-like 5 n=1 Tax=Ceratopteris richardii TaxID=49495 RepID=A0A8T2UN26_CERRI|nr:hypothetical protein KP509_05G077700 [Ceratopteris richardii]KAH7437548.1 hypothetical protein KP509_05G077700 [Ceratopteris richardii]